jgi:hypothetical protein
MLKTIRSKISKWLESAVAYAEALGRAKAAAELSRAGYHKEAKELLLRD